MSSTASASKTTIVAIMAIIAVVGAAVVMLGSSNESEAAIEGDYGQVYEVDLAPGFQYTYTPTYPSDLEVTVSIQEYEEEGLNASVSGGTLTVTVKDGVTSGSYDIVLMSVTNTAGLYQELPRHIRINVVEGLSVSGSINNIIVGASVDFTPQASSGMTENIDWSVKGDLPAGLAFSNGKVTGTPTQVGLNTLTLTANAGGETKDLAISFTVYNKIITGSAETITSYGTTVSSAAIEQTGADLGVTWAVTSGTLPAGFSLDPATGVVSGSSSVHQETTVTITGTAANGPAQSVTKDITIRSEPALALTADTNTVVIYPGAPDRTIQIGATSGTSAITWSVSPTTGISITQAGLLTVTDDASAGTATVTSSTAYGQTKTFQVTVSAESAVSISGSSSVAAIAGTPVESAFTVNVSGATWSIDTSSVPDGVTVTIDASTGILTLSGSSPAAAFTVTVSVVTESGQTDTMDVTCQVVSKLIYTNEPSNGLVVWVL